jgi:PEP-CTERM motif
MKVKLTVLRDLNLFKLFTMCLVAFPSAAFLVIPHLALADIYTVDRSFTFGTLNNTLTGTIEIPEGNYSIMNGGPSPFTTFNLTLTVSGTSFSLPYVVTSAISGTGEFFIDATSTNLVFYTANSNATNPADLAFAVLPSANAPDRYAIGSDRDPAFEAVITSEGVGHAPVVFPVVFGITTPVPEPSCLALVGIGLAAVFHCRRASVTASPNNSPEPPPIALSVPHSRLTRLVARLSFRR